VRDSEAPQLPQHRRRTLSGGQASAAGGVPGLLKRSGRLPTEPSDVVSKVRHAVVSSFGMINHEM
jgi:hypothetical protein